MEKLGLVEGSYCGLNDLRDVGKNDGPLVEPNKGGVVGLTDRYRTGGREGSFVGTMEGEGAGSADGVTPGLMAEYDEGEGVILELGEMVEEMPGVAPNVGVTDGKELGEIGINVGDVLGRSVGSREGSDVGKDVGDRDGRTLGILLGDSVGYDVGGGKDGTSVGRSVGSKDRTNNGATVGP